MGVVILTPADVQRYREAREPREVDWCACPIWQPCTCGNEAPVERSLAAGGWKVAR